MAEPVRKTGKPWVPEREVFEEAEERSVLQRWVKGPDGEMELLELSLTPELFLDPELDDKMVQGEWHDLTGVEISVLLRNHFRLQPDVRVFHDLKHLLGPGLPAPAPDVSVVRGIHDPEPLDSLDLAKEGVRPSLVIEVVSPLSARVRQTDLDRKVKLYQRVGIPEYLIADATRRRPGRRFTLLGYRLDAAGNYRSIEPDSQGRFLSETIGIWFQVSPDGQRIFLFEYPSGRRLLSLTEEEERANREAEARRAAEMEVARLRAELERLRGGA